MRVTLSINSGHSIELTYDQAASVMYELDDKPVFAGFFAEAANPFSKSNAMSRR